MITITLIADAVYGTSGQYVARITGRHPKFVFEREFVGSKSGKHGDRTEAEIDEPGLYEICNIEKKGAKDKRYRLVLVDETGAKSSEDLQSLVAWNMSEPEAMQIAKRMETGEPLAGMVRITTLTNGRPGALLVPKAEAARGVKR